MTSVCSSGLPSPLALLTQVRRAERAIGVGCKLTHADDGIQVDRTVDVRKNLTVPCVLILDWRGHPVAVDHQQHKVPLASEQKVGRTDHLSGRSAVDEAFAVQTGRAVVASHLGHVPG